MASKCYQTVTMGDYILVHIGIICVERRLEWLVLDRAGAMKQGSIDGRSFIKNEAEAPRSSGRQP